MEGDDIILNFPKLNPSTIGTMMMADTNNAAMTIIVEAFLDVMVFCGSSEFFSGKQSRGIVLLQLLKKGNDNDDGLFQLRMTCVIVVVGQERAKNKKAKSTFLFRLWFARLQRLG
jgi:hypothetical protein